MKKIMMFILPNCPYCKKALRYIEEEKAVHAELRDIEIEIHDESAEAEFADKFDYFYVPTFYIDGVKVHEGGIFEDEMGALLRKAL